MAFLKYLVKQCMFPFLSDHVRCYIVFSGHLSRFLCILSARAIGLSHENVKSPQPGTVPLGLFKTRPQSVNC